MKFKVVHFLLPCLFITLVMGQDCLWKKIKIPDYDIWNQPKDVDNITECRDECKKVGYCSFYSFNRITGKCYGKFLAGRYSGVKDDDFDTAWRTCVPEEPASCAQETSNVWLHNRTVEDAPDAIKCAEKCKNECKRW